ncbi:MAG: pyridine nucleotide-disulfide oxidoreductase [Calditrichaeota bacterium]|nr:MAG: pyridine nucleotide-disulfide oxidoreductase [Calditrichota bacterium]MBL1205368.1 pyridine nucleotide-disulfide oxidoreductase [Calditrichota bacterium]NOG45197.1 FAD-dependent oxidoreductase [Calditrichota bacterium]
MNTFKPLKIFIIGGVAAGMSAAARARKNDQRAEITVIQKEEDISYGACGLPYYIAGKVPDSQMLIARTIEEFEKQNIKILTGHEALNFQHHKKTLYIRRLKDGQNINFKYDRLIIATGARAKGLAIPGSHLKNVFSLRTLSDGLKIKSILNTNIPKKVVIVGSGYVGLEMAEAFSQQGLKVILVEKNGQLLKSVDPDIADKIALELQKNDCDVYLNSSLVGIQGNDKVEQVVLENAGIISTDMVLLASGIEPNVEFAKSCGVQLGKSGAIAVNSKMETNLHGVYAAGDCAEVKNLVTNRFNYLPLGTTANKQGRVAGDNASGHFAQMKGVVGTAVLKMFNLHIARTGISSVQAEQLGIKFETVLIDAFSRAAYSSCKKPITIKILFKKQTGQLLGAQIVGGEGVAKRLDLFAMALHQKMTVYDISELDLSYSPPFSPVWDPVLVTANEAIKKLKKK